MARGRGMVTKQNECWLLRQKPTESSRLRPPFPLALLLLLALLLWPPLRACHKECHRYLQLSASPTAIIRTSLRQLKYDRHLHHPLPLLLLLLVCLLDPHLRMQAMEDPLKVSCRQGSACPQQASSRLHSNIPNHQTSPVHHLLCLKLPVAHPPYRQAFRTLA